MSKKREQRVRAKKIAAKQQRNKKHAPPKWEDLARAAFSQIKIFRNMHDVIEVAANEKKEEASKELNKRMIAGFYKSLNEHYQVIETLLKTHSKTEKNEEGQDVFVMLQDKVKYPLKDDKSFTTQVDYFEGPIVKDELFKGYDLFSRYMDESLGITGLVELFNTVLEALGYVTKEDRDELLSKLNIEADSIKASTELTRLSMDNSINAIKAVDAIVNAVNNAEIKERTDGE